MLFNDRNNNQLKQEIGLDVMGGRNCESTPVQSLFRSLKAYCNKCHDDKKLN